MAGALVACSILACLVNYEFTVVEVRGLLDWLHALHESEHLTKKACRAAALWRMVLATAALPRNVLSWLSPCRHCHQDTGAVCQRSSLALALQVLFAFSVYVEAIKLIPQVYMIRALKDTNVPITNLYMFFQVHYPLQIHREGHSCGGIQAIAVTRCDCCGVSCAVAY